MKTILTYLKVVALTILTAGIYGAWWAFHDVAALTETDETMSAEEKRNRETQRAVSAAWITHSFFK